MAALMTIEDAARALREGKAVVFPTETVYGLGISVAANDSPQELFRIKGRPSNKPIAWLVSGAEDLARYGEAVPEYAYALAKAYWPGPLTLVVNASENVPAAFASAAHTIGLRSPNNEIALELVRAAGAPLATTSANLAGGASPGAFDQLDSVLLQRVAGAVPAGACASGTREGDAYASGTPSTIVDCTAAQPVILREGALSLEEILATIKEDSCSVTN